MKARFSTFKNQVRAAAVAVVAIVFAMLAGILVLRSVYQKFTASANHQYIECRRGSLPYYICITSPSIRAFPIIAPIEEPVFTSFNGPIRPYDEMPDRLSGLTGVRYSSSESREQIAGRLDTYFRSRGFV